MKTLYLERDQEKPIQYSDEGGFFVISKTTLGTEKTPPPFYDITTRQVFHQFEKSELMPDGTRTPTGQWNTGVSPAKSRVQVAVAQAQMETKNLKASPVGSLSKSKFVDPMHIAKKKLQ